MRQSIKVSTISLASAVVLVLALQLGGTGSGSSPESPGSSAKKEVVIPNQFMGYYRVHSVDRLDSISVALANGVRPGIPLKERASIGNHVLEGVLINKHGVFLIFVGQSVPFPLSITGCKACPDPRLDVAKLGLKYPQPYRVTASFDKDYTFEGWWIGEGQHLVKLYLDVPACSESVRKEFRNNEKIMEYVLWLFDPDYKPK